MTRKEIVEEIIQKRVVAVLRFDETVNSLKIIESLLKGRISAIEITMTTPNAFQLLEKISTIYADDLLLGVGTVLDTETAKSAIDCGAKFVVSPVLKTEIIQIVHENNLAVLPGCFTPTEIYTAHEHDADIIKVFPANILGKAFFKAVLAPMPDLLLMPTGGINVENAVEWLRAGVCALGIGSALVNKKTIANADYHTLTENALRLTNNIAEYRKSLQPD